MDKVEIIKAQSSSDNHPKELLRVAAYCRVSTDSAEQATSYNSQLVHYQDKIRNTPGWVLADVYADEGITGTSVEKRKEFQRMIEDCLAGKIDMVITKSLSRFSRNTEDTIKYVRLLRDKSIPIIFEEEHINTCSMDGELMLTVMGAIYQQEIMNTSNHLRLGFQMKMKRGELIGYNRSFGYDYDKTTKNLKIVPEEAAIVRLIFKLYLEGLGLSKICKRLEELKISPPRAKHWTIHSISRILNEVKYRGDLLQGKTYIVDPIKGNVSINHGERNRYYVKNHHEPIINPDDFDKVQTLLKKKCRKHKFVYGKHVDRTTDRCFSQKIYCLECGKAFASRKRVYNRTKEEYLTWYCRNLNHPTHRCINNTEWNNSLLEDAFVKSFNLLCRTGNASLESFINILKKVLNKKAKERKKLIEFVQDSVTTLQKQIDELLNLRLSGSITQQEFIPKYEIMRKKLDIAKKEINEVTATLSSNNNILSKIKSLIKKLQNFGPLDSFDKSIFNEVVDRIMIGTREDGDNYIVFIYRNGDKNDFNLSELKQAVDVKKKMNKVSASDNNSIVSAEIMCSPPSIKGMCVESSLDNQPTKRTHKSVKMSLHDNLSQFWQTLSSIEKQGIEMYQQTKDNCSMRSVNQTLHDSMSTNFETPSSLDIQGTSNDLGNIINLCSMCSVNGRPHRTPYSGNQSGADKSQGRPDLCQRLAGDFTAGCPGNSARRNP